VLLIAFLGVLILTVPLAGGRLGRLAHVRLRWVWVLGAALVLQVVIISLIPGSHGAVLRTAHVASYGLVGAFLWANRRVPGVWLIAAGGAMNFLAILANGGIMPTAPEAMAAAGLLEHPGRFANSAILSDPNLGFLGDVFAVPAPFPLHNVFSPGDVILALGVAVVLHRLCRSRLIPSGTGQFSGLFKYRDFRRMWAAQAISSLGDWIYSLAVVTSLAEREDAGHILAVILIAEVAPAAVAGILGGPLVDRLPRRALMIATDILRGVAVVSLVLAGSPSLGHFYAVAVCLGLLRALFQPSMQASLPNVVPRTRLVAANSVMSGTFHTAVMIGPILGGLLVTSVGSTAAFAVNAATFGISALFLWGVRLPRIPSVRERTSPRKDLVEGLRYSVRTPLVRGVLLVTGLVMVAAAIKSPLEPLFVFRALHGDTTDLGLIGGAWGLGMLFGSVAAPAVAARWARERILPAAIGAVGVAVLVAARSGAMPTVLLLWLIAGAANALGTVAYESLLQERTPDHLRGRVMGASEAVLDGAFLAGVSMAPWLGDALGVRGAYAIAGGLFLLTALASRFLLSSEPQPRSRAVAPGSDDMIPQPVLQPVRGDASP
jgi:MFS family permease